MSEQIALAGGPVKATEHAPHLICGTLASRDLDVARRFYEEFLGFECVRYAPDRMLVRDRFAKAAMEAGIKDFFLIEAIKVDEITHPQSFMNHWGLSVASREEVDRCHTTAKERKAELGLRRIQKITEVHGSYQFYFSDADENWWEIECRNKGIVNETYFERGDKVADNA